MRHAIFCRAAAAGLVLGLLTPAAAQTPILPVRGDAAAPIVIMIFSDFQCEPCAGAEPVLKTIREQFPTGVQVVFKHSPSTGHAEAALAHEAAIEAARQGKFWEMHDLHFAHQAQLQRAHLLDYARQLGLDVAAFTAALDARTHRAAVERDRSEARALGVGETPVFFVNGRRGSGVPPVAPLAGLIRNLLSGGDGSGPAPAPVTAFDLKDAPSKGAAAAPVTVVEFSDFQCGFCQRANATVAQILERYPGKVRFVFKHLPIDGHDAAPLAHRASLAAHQQGKFWEMHDRIFANQGAMARADLLAHATALGLDLPRFTADLDSPASGAIIDRDRKEGEALGIEGTPTFFINGTPLVGAQPLTAFATAIDAALAASPPKPAR